MTAENYYTKQISSVIKMEQILEILKKGDERFLSEAASVNRQKAR